MEPSLEEDLILKEEHLSKLFDSFFNRLSQEHILFSHKEGILHFVSDGILKISKKEARKLIGQHFKDILNWTDESISLYMRQYEKIILHQTNYVEFEMSFYDTADTERMLHIIQYARYDQDGNIASIDGLAQDITYIKKIGKENRYLHSHP